MNASGVCGIDFKYVVYLLKYKYPYVSDSSITKRAY